jgi:allophanate hydrolase subunit 2
VAQIAQVAMPKLAQIQVHQLVSFTLISHQKAVELLQQQQQYLLQIQNACIFKLKELLAI